MTLTLTLIMIQNRRRRHVTRSILILCTALQLLATTAYSQIAQRTNPKVTLAARDSRALAVAPGSANNLIAFSADPQNGARDMFHVISQETGLVITLIKPDGSEINATNATQQGFGYSVVNGSEYLNNPVLPAFSTPGTHTLFLLPAFSPRGTYQVRINATQVTASNVVIATYSSSSLIRAGLVTDAPTYRVGETVTLSGLLFDGAEPLTGANVSVAIGAQSLLEATPTQIALQDSGSSDLAASDGIYTGTFTASNPGAFYVAMRATGTKSGLAFSRLATTTFRVIQPLAKFSSFADSGVDDDSDDQVDRVIVSTNVDVQQAGRYQFSITLEAVNGARVQAAAVANLAAGSQQISVTFPSEELGTLAANGPYKLKDAVLTFQDDPEPPLADFRETAGNTSAYILSAAVRPPIVFTGVVTADGIDANQNGKFDLLRIQSGVNVSAAGIYTWSASLVDAAGEEIDFFNGSADLPQGNGSITFDFDGAGIGGHHANGPYSVRFVLVSGSGKSLALDTLFETQAFSVHEFENSDLTPPSTIFSLSQPANDAGWHNQPVRVSLAANDNPGGSDVKTVTYSATGAQTIAATSVSGSAATILFTTDGVTTIAYSAVDKLGNIESSRTLTIKLDQIPPTISATHSPQANSNGWNNTDVTASFTASDSLSGFSSGQTVSGTYVFAAEGSGQSHTFTVTDLAGNSASVSVEDINIDKTAPTVIAPATLSATSDINCEAVIPNVLPQVTASDLVSGGVNLNQSPAAGTRVGVGSHAITITATDAAGNSNTATTIFTVNGVPSFSVSVNPNTAKRGAVVSLATAYRNCASSRQELILKVSLTRPSRQDLMATLPITLQPGQKGSLNIPIRIPSSTPTGLYSITLDVYVGGIKIGTSTAQLTVTP